MVKRSVRAYVELASGLGEMTRARAVEAAQEIVALAGSGGSASAIAQQVERLAGDLLKAAEQNRAQVVGLVQREVEAALDRVDVGRVLAEVQSLGATVAGLAAQVEEMTRSTARRPAGAGATVADTAEPALAAPPARVTAPSVTKAPAKKTTARTSSSTAKKASAKKSAPSATKAATKKTTARTSSSTAKKAPAKKAATKKSVPSAKKAATKKSVPSAKKAATKKTTARTSASTAKKAPAKKAPAKTSATQRSAGS